MAKYVTRMAKSGESESYAVKDVGARELISAEAEARQQAVAAEAGARQQAVSAEATAREAADNEIEERSDLIDKIPFLHNFDSEDMVFIKSVSVFDRNYSRYGISYVWIGSHGYTYLFRLEGTNDDGATWTNLEDVFLQSGDIPAGVETIYGSKFAITVNWEEAPETLDSSSKKIIKDYNAPTLIADDRIKKYDSPFVGRWRELDFILDIQVKNTSYKYYSIQYAWINNNGYHYLFRLQGSNDGVNFSYISDIQTQTVPETKPDVQLLSNNDFDIVIDWTKAPSFLANTGNKTIKADRMKNVSYKYQNVEEMILMDDSPFSYRYPDLDWITDIQISGGHYKHYRATYTWINSPPWRYYVRIQGSDDGSNWSDFDNIESTTFPEDAPDVEIGQGIYTTIVFDWTKAPASYYNSSVKYIKDSRGIGLSQYYAGLGTPKAGYAVKDETNHYVVIDANGTGDYTNIADAFEYIRSQNPTITNQFEVIVKPGRYDSLANIVPPFTHMHGQIPNTVVITSEAYAGQTTDPTLRQDFGSSKLSNLHIISATGYCIHYDQGLNGRIIRNENLILEKKEYGAIIGGGGWLEGALFIWTNCTFVNGYAACHTNRHGWENTRVEFDNCKFAKANMRCGDVGGQGAEYIFEINNSFTNLGDITLQGWQDDWLDSPDPTFYMANTCEWQIIGRNNKNFLPVVTSNGKGLMVETAEVNQQIELSGTAVPVLFGLAKIRKGNARLKGRAYGVYRVQDKRAGDVRGQEGIDVFQMWKRLGDCSTNPLSLTVTVGNQSQTYNFTTDYTASKPSEETILADINNIFSIAEIKEYVPDCWENIQTEEKTFIVASGNDGIKAGEYVRYDGTRCQANDGAGIVYGRALEDGASGELVQVWIGNVFKTSLPAGEYGIGSDGTLSESATTKIGYVMSNGVFVRN